MPACTVPYWMIDFPVKRGISAVDALPPLQNWGMRMPGAGHAEPEWLTRKGPIHTRLVRLGWTLPRFDATCR